MALRTYGSDTLNGASVGVRGVCRRQFDLTDEE